MIHSQNRKIIHVDMDCFFAAVEMRDHPHLKDLPIAVGGLEGRRGVICTANYKAREFGVRSALPSITAMRLCPELKLMPVRHSVYREESQKVFAIFRDFTDIIQPLSLDEAFLDVTECDLFQGSATLIAQEIRRRIRDEIKLTASAGIAPNKFLAKIASDWNKPDGQFVIPPSGVDEFIKKVPVKNIWGCGKRTLEKMHLLGLKTCADLQKWEEVDLVKYFGKFGADLYLLSRGIDNRPVNPNRERKSYSNERTFIEDVTPDHCRQKLAKIFAEAELGIKRFLSKNDEYCIKASFVKIKFADFQTTTIERHHLEFTLQNCQALLEEGFLRSGLRIRLLGCGVKFGKKEENLQMDLF